MTALPTETLPTALPTVVRPALRIVPAPVSAPPYDDEPGTAPLLRLVTSVATEPAPFNDDAWVAAERTPVSQLPAAKAFAHALIQATLEVLAGVRPIKQLRRDTTPEVYTALADGLPARPKAIGERPTPRAVRSLHVQERPEGIAEVCATIRRGERTLAVALRLEGMDGRWKCTELVGV